jgi:hypothetical protein
MIPVPEAELTPTGSTPVYKLEEVEPVVTTNAEKTHISVHLGKEPLPLPRTIQLGSMPHKRFRVLKPISVELSRAGEFMIASVAEFEEFGQGENSSEAIDDLTHSIEELFLSLEEEEARLGPDLRALLARLRAHLSLVTLKTER